VRNTTRIHWWKRWSRSAGCSAVALLELQRGKRAGSVIDESHAGITLYGVNGCSLPCDLSGPLAIQKTNLMVEVSVADNAGGDEQTRVF
jgi:hypothetical protein